ncbi:fumarylacetoacetate hydrolase family protein [Actinomadura madurae]|uniref:fumarylacetoacetate hydrolase family protein n=1 Tax=Actinomadura madurae TaxID=1993 RepID=UPI0020D25FF4|nr:fumarylacetoacetate hydrolase family protein [Actinomadura madurae]MCQ0008042.1 fumarylacetoacetate hydrolase family protein [Actinomadura madurae]
MRTANLAAASSWSTAARPWTSPSCSSGCRGCARLYPGDLIFTGTPSGVGNARTPKRFLRPGEVLVSELEGVGRLAQRFAAAPDGR